MITFSVASHAQYSAIDIARLSPKIEKLLEKDQIVTTADLQSLTSSCYIPADSSLFCYHEKEFIIEAGIDEVWLAYKTIRPEEAWQGKIGSFAFMYSRFSGKLTYKNDAYYGMEVGQVIFMNLKFLGGLFNLAVGHEVTRLDEEKKLIQFCYLENGKSEGSQLIYLTETSEGNTLVTHRTRYRSDSEFRDQKLYPPLHALIISEYHKSVAALAES